MPAPDPKMLAAIRALQEKLISVADDMNRIRADHSAIVEFQFEGPPGGQKLTRFVVLAPMDLAKHAS